MIDLINSSISRHAKKREKFEQKCKSLKKKKKKRSKMGTKLGAKKEDEPKIKEWRANDEAKKSEKKWNHYKI